MPIWSNTMLQPLLLPDFRPSVFKLLHSSLEFSLFSVGSSKPPICALDFDLKIPSLALLGLLLGSSSNCSSFMYRSISSSTSDLFCSQPKRLFFLRRLDLLDVADVSVGDISGVSSAGGGDGVQRVGGTSEVVDMGAGVSGTGFVSVIVLLLGVAVVLVGISGRTGIGGAVPILVMASGVWFSKGEIVVAFVVAAVIVAVRVSSFLISAGSS